MSWLLSQLDYRRHTGFAGMPFGDVDGGAGRSGRGPPAGTASRAVTPSGRGGGLLEDGVDAFRQVAVGQADQAAADVGGAEQVGLAGQHVEAVGRGERDQHEAPLVVELQISRPYASQYRL